MATDLFENYYWEIYALIFESADILDIEDSTFSLSYPDTARIAQAIHAVLPFLDGSRLYIEVSLTDEGEAVEDRYAYIYYDAGGRRIFQYDNRRHHPEISTHPHHMHRGPIPAPGERDRAWPTDIDFIAFETVLNRIRERFFG